jgi:uncharacterized protein
VFGERADGREVLLSIGEAKWNDSMGLAHLDRLRTIRDLIAATGRIDTSQTKLACYSGAGFMPALVDATRDGAVMLVGLSDLYHEDQS